MQSATKADRGLKTITGMSDFDKQWLFGNETGDPLRFAFDSKRVIHPTVRGNIVPKKDFLSLWNNLAGQYCKGSKRAVYIHIPFCQTRCLYCGFFQNFANPYLENSYIETLTAEIEMASGLPLISSHPNHAVYIGGGTPSALSAKNIQKLLKTVHSNLPLANDCEITFESRFHEFDNEKIEACLGGGVNRFSLGVQSFDRTVRKGIGRIDGIEAIFEKLQYLLKLDNAAVVIDLMYGLPQQSMEVWRADVSGLIESRIDGGDLYQLNVFGDSKLKEAVDRGLLSPPSKTSEQALMFKQGVEIMEKARYKRLSINHWSRNTRERNLYNQLSKSNAVTIPFGAGAGGKIEGYAFFIDRDVNSYIQRIDKGEKPLMFMASPLDEHELYSDIIVQMDIGALDIAGLSSKYGIDLNDLLSPLFSSWQAKDLIKMTDGFLELTIAGQFWYVNLTQALLDWLVIIKNNANHTLNVSAIAAQG